MELDDDMEAADAEFCRAIRYLEAVQRLQAWSGDDETESRLARLAEVYRARATALILGGVAASHVATGKFKRA
jgi:hypothetical protein